MVNTPEPTSPESPASDANGTSRPDAIRAGAARVFSAHGYAATSMREIAAETGASLGSIYHHFASKGEDLSWMIRVEEEFHKMVRDWLSELR